MSPQRMVGVALILAVVTACSSTGSTPAPTTTITLPADAQPIMSSPPLAPASVEDPADTDIGHLDITTLEAVRRDDSVDLALTMAEPRPTDAPTSGERVSYELVLHPEGQDLAGWRLTVATGESGELAASLSDLASSEEILPFPGSLVVDGERLNVTLSPPDLGQASTLGICAIARSSTPDGEVLEEDVAPDQAAVDCEEGTGQQLEL